MQHAQAGAHHQGVGFTTEISLLAGGHFDGSDQCAAGGGDAVLDGAGDIRIGTDKFSAGHDQVGRFCQSIQRIGATLADYNIIGVNIIHCDAGIV